MEQERRRATRHTCEKQVGYATQGVHYIDFIQDINAWGVFIKSRQNLPVGKSILISIPLFGDETAIKVAGEVVWTNPEGMGIRFTMGIGENTVLSILEKDDD